jgi:hypothetical protein
MRCGKCGSDNPDSKRFCGDCGSTLAEPRARNAALRIRQRKSSAAIVVTRGSAAESARGPKRSADDEIRLNHAEAFEATDGEGQTNTVLFADIKGSMGQIEDLDPEEARAVVDPALACRVPWRHPVVRNSSLRELLAPEFDLRCN